MKKLSLIVPVYNVEKYLDKCLSSLVNQTLKDIEIIVVNDGSPDNSQSIIDKYVKKYPNIVFSYKKKNGGLSSARNYGIKKAKGEYIGFVDSDDYVDLNLFESMYNEAKKENADVVGCQVKFDYKDRSNYNEINKTIFNKSIVESPDILLEIKSYAPNKIYKRDFWNNNKFEFPNQFFEDSALIYNVLVSANKVCCIFDAFYHYNRTNETSITRIVDNRMYDIFKSCDSILNYYKNNNSYEIIKDKVDYICIKHIIYRIKTYINANETKKLKEFINYSHNYLDKNIPNWRKSNLNSSSDSKSIHNRLYCFIFKNNVILNVYIFLRKIKHRGNYE